MISYPKRVGSIITRVIESGTGGPPIIFVHGVSAYAHRWLQNVEAIGKMRRHGYAFDLPGHGFATKSAEFDHSVPAYAAFLEQFMDAVGTRTAILIGTSLGGHIVGMATCRTPERVHALVMAGSLGIVPVGAAVRQKIAAAILDTGRPGIRAKLERAHADSSVVTDEWVEEEFQINNSPGAKDTFAHLAQYIIAKLDEDCIGTELAQHAAGIPTLLVWGEHDQSVHLEVAAAAHKALPGARLAVLKDAGHAPYFERPPAFNGLLSDFLSGGLDSSSAENVIYR